MVCQLWKLNKEDWTKPCPLPFEEERVIFNKNNPCLEIQSYLFNCHDHQFLKENKKTKDFRKYDDAGISKLS